MVKDKNLVRPKRYGFFFLNGLLYRTIHADKRSNLLYAYDARDGSIQSFLYSDVRKHSQKAFRIGAVAELLGCKPKTVKILEEKGMVRPAQRWAGPELDYRINARYYSEDQVRELRQVMSEIHRGRPRHDGIVIPRKSLPTAEELEAAMRHTTVLYEDIGGELIPVWRAKF